MKRVLFAGFLLVAAWCALAQAADGGAPRFQLKKGDRVAIVGDSITEQRQYSAMIESYLRACLPELETQVIQLGWGGERAGGFAARMENDLMGWEPTVVTLCYGMNDGGYESYKEATGAEYRKQMETIARRLADAGVRTVVGSPGVVDSFTWRRKGAEAHVEYNKTLAKLGEIGAEVAAAHGFAFADVHGVMMDAMTRAKAQHGESFPVAGNDGVHPGPNGHLCMAYAFLKALGADGNIGEISVALPANVTASAGHQAAAKALENGVEVEVVSSRYPFCFTGAIDSAEGTAGMTPFLPFNKDLNRFILKVEGLQTAQARVVWGKHEKVFSREDLAAGINLAEAFFDNPFSAKFAELYGAVVNKQSGETRVVKGALTQLRGLAGEFGSNDAEVTAAIATLRQKLLARLNRPQKAVQDKVVPLKHTITIVPQ